MKSYDDIIGIPHWEPSSHPRMSASDRAAQFAPFAALTGYDAMVREKSRLTDAKVELDEEQILALNETLTKIMQCINNHPEVSVIWFRKDEVKQGGVYERTDGMVRDVDFSDRTVVLKGGERISLDDIASLTLKEHPAV